jgi:hypothetical protein
MGKVVLSYNPRSSPKWSGQHKGTIKKGKVSFQNTSNLTCRLIFQKTAAFKIIRIDLEPHSIVALEFLGPKTSYKAETGPPRFVGSGDITGTIPPGNK